MGWEIGNLGVCQSGGSKTIVQESFKGNRVVPLTGELWDGKLGIWAFAKAVEAKQLFKNRSKGTSE